MANYTSEQETLRAAITNFIGVAASSSLYEGKDAVRNVVALFLEELVQYAQEDDAINMNAVKPILRASVYILEERARNVRNSYRQSFNSEPPETITQELDLLVKLLTEYINKI